LPLPLDPPARPAVHFRVSPYSACADRAGDEIAGCPAASVHSLCRQWIFESPRISHLPRRWFKCFRELPRFLTPPCDACRCSSRVSPRSASSGFASDRASSRLDSRILRRCRLAELRVAPSFRPSVSPTIRCSSYPEPRIFRHWLVIVPSHPGCFHLPALPAANLQISPDLLIPWLHQLRELPSCLGSSLLWRRRLTN